MKAILILSLALFALAVVQGEKVVCKMEDSACLTETAGSVFPAFAAGVPGEVESSDPLYQEKIEADLSELYYMLTNAKLFGVKDCLVELVKFSEEDKKYEYCIACPLLKLVADYEISGEIGEQPIKGQGDLVIEFYDHVFCFSGHYASYEDEQGKSHINLKTYSVEVQNNRKAVYQLNNLFDGDKKKSDKMHKYLNKNSQLVEKKILAVWIAFGKPYMTNVNALLKVEPFDDLFSKEY